MALTSRKREKIYHRDKYVCRYCGKHLLDTVEEWYLCEIDHIDPKGGDNNDNLVVACRSCNLMKVGCILTDAKSPNEMIERIKDHIVLRNNGGQNTIKGLLKWIAQPNDNPPEFKKSLEVFSVSEERLGQDEDVQQRFEIESV